jgi:hypothetical protein
MRKIICLCLIFTVCLSLVGCREEQNAYDILSEFASTYGAEGVIYSPSVSEGSPGYISDRLVERVFLFTEGLGDNFALLLNSHIDLPSECGVFVCSDDEEVRLAEEICLERVRLLSGNGGFVKKRGRVVYYYVLSDPGRAERIFREIIK